jgi:hypothetical protein
MKRFLILFSIFFLCSSAFAARVEPQKDVAVRGDFDLGPTSFSVKVEPGETVKKTLQLTNRKGFTQKFLVEVEDFEGTNDINQPIVFSGKKSGKFGAKDWIAVELNEFIIEHGERQFFDVNIKIPETADVGDHYGAVLVSAIPPDEDRDESRKTAPNINIHSRVGSLFYIQVQGDIKEEGKLESFEVGKKWYEKGPIRFSSIFRNTGSVRLKPFGKIEITDFRGKIIETLDVEPFNVLRDSIRQDIRLWETEDWLGYYKAKLVINRGYGNIIDEKEVTFLIISWKKLSVAVIILVVIIFLLVLTKKKLSFSIKIESKKDQKSEIAEKKEDSENTEEIKKE